MLLKDYAIKPKTVLIIEDNELNMKLVRSLLRLDNYKLIEAGNAELGILFARNHRPDLIFMDIQLPGMDGIEATQSIKKDPKLRDIPIVVLTSYAMQRDEEKARNAGCVGYITKPVDTRSFLQSITQYF